MSERDSSKREAAACNGETSLTLIFSLKKEKGVLVNVFQKFDELDVTLSHIESRPSKSSPGAEYDFYVDSHCPKEKRDALMKKLRVCTTEVNVLNSEADQDDGCYRTTDGGHRVPWFPQTISEVHRCCTRLYKYGAELAEDHPGYGDHTYSERRKFIAHLSQQYRYGCPIPRLEYTEEEVRTWEKVFSHQTKLYPTHACKEYIQHFPQMFEMCGYRKDNIPQLEDISRYLKSKTGWQLWPVIGWISSRDFLNALAFRVFPSSQYIRHASSPLYTPEPDICHELIGHAPLFCDPSFAQFSQEVGLASLGVSDEWIEKLGSLYWFTVEFGIVREEGQLKAYGAGLLSGSEELSYCITNKPQHREFNIEGAMATKYPETGLQPLYFVVESLRDMRTKMIDFVKIIPRDFAITYDPYTQSVVTLDSGTAVEQYARDIEHQMTVLHGALRKQIS